MPTIKITNINFKTLLSFEPLLKELSPDVVIGDLNASLLFISETPGPWVPVLTIKEPLAFVQVRLPAEVQVAGQEGEGDLGVSFNYQRFFQVLHAYKPEALSKLAITLKLGEHSTFKIEVPGNHDTMVHLPNLPINQDRINDLQAILSAGFPEDSEIGFDLSDLNDDRPDFLEGLGHCLSFIGSDERKNNAVMVFQHQMVSGDRRHIFIHTFNHPIEMLSRTVPVNIHKKPAKLILTMGKKSPGFRALITKDNKRIFVMDDNFVGLLNNAMANSLPPSEEEMKEYTPTTVVARPGAGILLESADFVSGFYRSGEGMKVLSFSVEKDSILLSMKEDSVADFSACDVERRIPCNTNEVSNSILIIQDGFLPFFKTVDPEEDLEFYLEKDEDKKQALMIVSRKKKILFSKVT